MKALITAGGHGTRLRPITHTQNKHLIPIANKLMLGYALDYVREADIREVGIVVNAGDTSIQDVFGSGQDYGVKITYIPQEAPLGLAHVVKISHDFIQDEPFIFYLGDNILVGGIQRFVQDFQTKKSNCHLVLSKVPDPNRFGVAEIKDGEIIDIEEKPEKPKSDMAVTGIYLYDHHIFEAVNSIQPSDRGELEISDAHQYLLDHNLRVTYSEITGWWKDTGKPDDLLEANRLVLDSIQSQQKGIIDQDSSVKGRVQIGAGSNIINSTIRGPVVIGENVQIKNSFIGPYTSIGNDGIVENSEIEFSIIMDGCRIRSIARRIEASLMGQNVEIETVRRVPKTHRFMLGDQSRVELA